MKIARKDWIEFVRDRRLVALAALALLIALAALATSWARVTAYEADRSAAQALDVETWNSQGERNPHGAAHFGEWAMRPLTAMAVLDPGVTPYAGTVVWLEGHSWNPARNRPVEDREGVFDLGGFSLAWTLQLLFPLVIFVLCAGLVARERERGTLRQLLASGVSAKQVMRGKFGSLARLIGLLALPTLLVALIAVAAVGAADWARLLLWCGVYLLFWFTIAAIALAVSAIARTSAQAMLILVGIWLFAGLLVPRAGAALAGIAEPVPTPDAFWARYIEEKGELPEVFGDGAERYTADVMRRYGVTRPEDLPVSLGGLQLEEDERYGNQVFDRLYGELEGTYEAQRGIVRWTSVLTPLPALQNLSQTLAATSLPDQIDFQRQGEMHRRRFVTFLNTDMIENADGAEFDYVAGEELWRETPRFAYRQPTLTESLRRALPDALILLAWAIAAVLLLRFARTRLDREVR